MNQAERGSAAVEAALVFPILMMLILGIMEYGKYFYDVYRYQQAVYAGARVGAIAVNNKDAVAEEEAKRVLAAMGISTDKMPVIVVQSDVATPVGGRTATTVTIDNAYTPIIGYDSVIMPARINVVASQLNY